MGSPEDIIYDAAATIGGMKIETGRPLCFWRPSPAQSLLFSHGTICSPAVGQMMKYAGHALFASVSPFHSVIPKGHGRLSPKLIYGKPLKSRKFECYYQKHMCHKESMPPPWFSVAPMMDFTDNHYRTFARLISKHAWLYTEMIAAGTIVYQKGNLDRFLAFGPEQHPIVLQIGGNDLENLAKATELANSYCYDEINLNCGCPSPKVAGKGCFGVRLMLDPKFVANAICVISAHTNVPVSVKCRIGVDDHDSYNELCEFIDKVSSQSPTKHFIIHSRKALLNGISTKENRSIPPLKLHESISLNEHQKGVSYMHPRDVVYLYEYFYALLRDFPDLQFTINGGINTIDEVNEARREGAHGVMIGRAAYHNPWNLLGHVDSAIYGAPPGNLTRRQVLEKYQLYGDSVLGLYGTKPNLRDVVKPLLGFFHSAPGNSLWKRKADAAFQNCTTIKSFLEETLVAIPDDVLDSPLTEAPLVFSDAFAKSKSLLPPPYTVREAELLYA